MVFNTATVSSAVTPVVIHTFLSHYLNRKARAEKPTAHISYDEGLQLIRQFLLYASRHTVEDIQRFTSQWVPNPRWVKVNEIKISQEHISKSADAIQIQLGHHGISRVGGETWWQWRRPGSELKAEWIEMRADYHQRKRSKDSGKRVMLYIHGGAYYFGSVDEHRYQMQRHARKLKARDPSTIILAGDSAGGGMVLSMLVTLRDQGLPLPAGAVLISPWVDLTNSFPSVALDNPMDYIPPWGFHHRPSPAWPPPNSDDMLTAEEDIVKKRAHIGHQKHPEQSEEDAVRGFRIYHNVQVENQNNEAIPETETRKDGRPQPNPVPRNGNMSIMIGGNLVEVKDQIQMYATNQLITHPLVSPVLQPSLGGLPPLLIMVGGGEMLRDEQIYLAHKAANPTKYPPSDAFLDEYPHDHARSQIDRWKPTDVQLQVWDDLCHVAPTLSFTRPAKYMYRSIAQFGAWALAKAQKAGIEIMDDDDVSVISRSESDDEDVRPEKEMGTVPAEPHHDCGQVGKAGDPLPRFKNHMIRQSVDRHGNTYRLRPESKLPGCNMPANQIGVINDGLLRKWMARKEEWDTKYASTKRKVQKQRAREIAKGYQEFGNGEVPPPSALAGRRLKGKDLKEGKNKRSMGMSLWALWGSKHDEKTIEAEQEADRAPETTSVSPAGGAAARGLHPSQPEKDMDNRSRSRRRIVTDEYQTSDGVDENTSAVDMLAIKEGKGNTQNQAPNSAAQPSILVRAPTNQNEGDDFDRKRPKAGGIAFPFSLSGHKATASMTTLTSAVGVSPGEDIETPGAREDGLERDSEREDGKAVGDRKALGKGVQRPPLETFVTASEGLPVVNGL
ncbi:uncharacterized protein BP5553_04625 [Venustampulla echinocandica]|uniref:Alpha/beta hydrolase fold-3 domain-containing protein n=1 Tax=Venustampulla echinocandica TaxID=2656787 RepID=A0A370TNU0_9HELO|nr:uncharacterized protein BP5553_04625 [Venustampulla echinocandica]RDL37192.1 hypothetical protein BP5553_04625 [Venustampulla echinocandica]